MNDGKRYVHIVDDDSSVRRSTAILLRVNGFYVEQWRSGRAFVEAVDAIRPGCVLLDLRMPDIDGLAVLDQMAMRGIRLPVIVMTGHGDMGAAIRAMKTGATEFLEKPVEKAVLIAAIDFALAKHASACSHAAMVKHARDAVAALTPRERDVLVGLTHGLPNKSIAGRLGISPRTVEIHRANAMARLDAQNLSQALRIALTAGLGEIGAATD